MKATILAHHELVCKLLKHILLSSLLKINLMWTELAAVTQPRHIGRVTPAGEHTSKENYGAKTADRAVRHDFRLMGQKKILKTLGGIAGMSGIRPASSFK